LAFFGPFTGLDHLAFLLFSRLDLAPWQKVDLVILWNSIIRWSKSSHYCCNWDF